MKKYFLISSILAVIMLIVGSIGLLATGEAFTGISFGNYGVKFNGVAESFTQEIDVVSSNIKFNLNVPNTKVEIYSGTNKRIIVNCWYNNENDKFTIDSNEDTINIKRKESYGTINLFDFSSIAGTVEIIVPESIIGNYTVESTNGNIEINDIKASNIDIETTNGNFEIGDITVEGEVKINTNNGRVVAEDINAESISFETTNGLVDIEDIKANDIRVRTTNGLIKAYNCYSKDIILRTTNGAITLENEDKNYQIENLDVNTTNGKETVNANYKNRK
ncbi:DUF4097 family beta strand repeat-containing protein [Clostridium disporicum]|uniref:DUF4097 domain-containing protein n=1 Tax=Clostridium disporicum TaxID=84024 RepID=A0A174KGI5_9CLOT|nr:DUF4097 family beta strand repeat-containing protein [Clostridium disporicum]CUP09576.1 Uncharacterised protein [Clostridium disporicum]